ncbi:MAG TPA: 2Fe-2S iron-sulfur cluster-binding protein [Streptosporangiaceae bacterium]|nr:2Fe-2S iron-sulfur cluster-binding protein [Streptosporangiaceae bacterium]
MTAPNISSRLPRQPGEVIDRTRSLEFTWNGRAYQAFEGDTIVSALAAAGERVFSRSLKYRRPRGLLTATFHDPGCLLQVDDEPNVRGAHRLVTSGMEVSAQAVWPSLKVDAKAASRLAGRFLSAGFYYKTFMRPKPLWPAYEAVLRRFVNAGAVSPSTPRHERDKRHAHPDVLVAGGGPAGMAAAVAAARAGARVMLAEEEHQLGGHLRWGGESERAAVSELAAQVAAEPGIEVLLNAAVIGRYDGNLVAVLDRGPDGAESERLIRARAKTFIAAPGLIERPYVVAGNDLPGVMLSTAVRRLVSLYAVRPGQRAVVLTANADGDAAVEDLRRAGVEVARVEDARTGGDIIKILGTNGVRAARLSDGSTVDCDLVVTATGWTAPTSLLNMAGNRPVYDRKAARFFPDAATLPPDVLVAGGIAGDGTLDQLLAHAKATGAEAARRARAVARARAAAVPTRPAPPAGALPAGALPAGESPANEPPANEPAPLPALPVYPHPELFRGQTHGIVDFSEDVSSRDLAGAVAEGFSGVELAKRFTTATMGPAQGKLETVNAVAVVAQAAGLSIAQAGTTTWRPPYVPVTLGALAGRPAEPERRSPMQDWHEAHGARPLLAGAWVRPDSYGDPAAEVRNVRERVGIIDVTPLGKLDLRGPDVPELLNLLYVNKWSKLGIGRVRYGVMCAEDGVVLDDGVTGRLGPEHYLMSTTSSGAAAIWEWAEHWKQTAHPDWQVAITPVTTAYASINVAGPASRELMRRLTEGVDLGPEAFPYMNVRSGRIAGAGNCVLWRIGFTGELSYELHVPAGYGLHVWEALLATGKDLGVAPFGVEAQRILRLEQGHFIVGQDTDGLTRGFSAGLGPLVKLDKTDFLGQPELAWQQAAGDGAAGDRAAGDRAAGDGAAGDRTAGDGPRLVGLQPVDGSVVPEEASLVMEGRRIAGRITSSRMSPTLGRSVCLAQVLSRLAGPGTLVTVRLPSGQEIEARVTPQLAHHDPEGTRSHG